MYILFFILGISVTGSLGYFLYKKNLLKFILKEQRSLDKIVKQKSILLKEIEDNQVIKDNLVNNISKSQKEIDIIINNYKKQAEESFDNSLESLAKEYESNKEAYIKEYEQLEKEMTEELTLRAQNLIKNIEENEIKIAELRSKVTSAVEASKREEEKRNKLNYYKLCLSEQDIKEVESLKEVASSLRNPEALNKVIWKMYYENPYTSLLGRVLKNKNITGIYKITNIVNNKCYVGQAVNVGERWKQHIRKGLGAETPTKNKLYPAMDKYGVHNFTFELIEECKREDLNSREDYWQDYFKAKEYGYSIR